MALRALKGWAHTKWGNLASLEYGKSLRDYDEQPSPQKPYRVFGTNGPIGFHSSPLCERASVVVGRKGAYRGIHFSADPFFVIDTAFYLRPKTDLDIRWAYYQLKNFDINKLDSGSAIPSTSREAFYEIPVLLPPLSVQHQLAGILSAYDELIENSQRRITILEAMTRALYREWFVEFRFPGHESHPRVASSLGEIPAGWEVRTVDEIVERISVGRKYDQKTVNSTGAVPVLDQGKSGIIGYHDDEPGVFASETDPVIVFANHTCYQRLIHVPFSAIQNVLPFVPNPSLARNIYWVHWATNGVVAFNDYKGHWPEFAAKALIVPPAALCERFGEFAAPLSRQGLRLDRQIQNLRRTRDMLLPRVLSGQVNLEAA